jgi:hypothetical protein
MRPLPALVGSALLALCPISAGAHGGGWEHYKTVQGIFDLGGPRTDGTLVVAGFGALYLMSPEGDLTPFARGAGGYHDDRGSEAYLAVAAAAHVASAGCSFTADETYVLRLHAPVGVTRVDKPGDITGSFANVGGVSGLNGIVFDTTGAFDHRLLVSGPFKGKTAIMAIDCTGAVQVITQAAPVLEGGLAVAPMGFGAFGGSLVAPDELGGVIWAIRPDGTATKLVDSGLPHGQDTGVESLGFVPPGFARGGDVFYSDRATPGNPHPGSDSLLRLSGADLVGAGVQDGDLLAATEGGATMIDIRCAATCVVNTVVATPTAAHGEGHIAFTVGPQASPTPSSGPEPAPAGSNVPVGSYVALAAAVLAALAVALLAGSRRRT